MALIFKDRVKETTTTTGQGTVTLLGSVDGFRSFADIGDANTTYYCIFDNSANTFEIGIGTYTASGTTLSRDTVLQTSSGNTTKINFASGNKEVFCVYPAGKAVYLDENGDLTINGVKHLNAISNRWTKTATSNQTVFTGNSDDSTTLSVGEHTQVFLNGIMLKKTTDYALSNNDTITLTSGASANDILESITFAPFTVASALQPSNNLSDVSSASTALSNLGGMSSSGGTFSGNVSLGSNDLSTTGKILFANVYSQLSDLPSPSTYHGMFAHVHGTQKAYFAHAGNWVELANASDLSSYLPTASANSTIDSHLNVSSASTNQYLQWSGSDYQWAGVSGYTDSDVDTHLNQSSASSNQFLQWNGSDYSWSVPTDTNTTYSAGSGIDLSGTTFSHSDTSSQSSSNNSGRTYIQDITLDTYGHVTGIATATETVTNTDTNTTYSAGTNLGLSGTTFNLDNSITLSGTAQATRYYIDGTSKFIDSASGNYGTIRVEGGNADGYAIRDDFVFMSSSTDYCGIYNDMDNEWQALFYRNERVELRHNGLESLRTHSQGIRVRTNTYPYTDATIYLGTNNHAYIYNDEDTAIMINNGVNERVIYGQENGHTYLYHNGNWSIRTNASGIQVRNTSTTTDGTLALGSSEHAKIYNDEGSYISITTGANENAVYMQENGYTYLYYNGSWRLRATNQGIAINGALSTSANDTSYGTSGQVLTSNGNASPSWVSPSTLSGVGGVWEEVSNTNFSGVTQVNISVSTGYLYNIIFSDLLITSTTNAARFDFKAISSSSTLQGFRASRSRINNSTSFQTYYSSILQTGNIALGYSNNVARQNQGTKSQTFDFWYHQGTTNTSNMNWASFWCTGWGQGGIVANPVIDICHGYQYQSGGATIATLGFFASTTTIQGNYRVLRIQV